MGSIINVVCVLIFRVYLNSDEGSQRKAITTCDERREGNQHRDRRNQFSFNPGENIKAGLLTSVSFRRVLASHKPSIIRIKVFSHEEEQGNNMQYFKRVFAPPLHIKPVTDKINYSFQKTMQIFRNLWLG